MSKKNPQKFVESMDEKTTYELWFSYIHGIHFTSIIASHPEKNPQTPTKTVDEIPMKKFP